MINIFSREKTAAIIKNARKSETTYSQIEIAHMLGLECRQSYADIETGKKEPHLEYIYKLCDIFQCDIGYLLGEYPTKKREAADVQKVTGLSEKAIEKLMELKRYEESPEVHNEQYITEDTFILHTINLLLEHEEMHNILFNIAAYIFTNDDAVEKDDFGLSILILNNNNSEKKRVINGDTVKNIFLTEIQNGVVRLHDKLRNTK